MTKRQSPDRHPLQWQRAATSSAADLFPGHTPYSTANELTAFVVNGTVVAVTSISVAKPRRLTCS